MANHNAPGQRPIQVPAGFPGRQWAIVATEFPPGDPRNEGGPGGAPGQYKVVFTLSRPGFPLTLEYQIDFGEALAGDSHLAIRGTAFTPPGLPDATQIRLRAENGADLVVFDGYPNERGFLSQIVTTVEANSLEDAEIRAYRFLAPTFSHWSTTLDIPISIFRIHVTELRTEHSRISFVSPFLESPITTAGDGILSAEFRGYASLYREAVNTNSEVFQFLCFFKIIEALRERRARLAAAARSRGEEPSAKLHEVLPVTPADFQPWLNAIYPVRPALWHEADLANIFLPEALGRRISRIVEDELRAIRVAVAHALFSDPGELTLSADEALHMRRLAKWLPLAKSVVRRMLKNDFPPFLAFLPEPQG